VSCSAPDACTAVGYDETINTFPVTTLAERWNGRRWTRQATPNPSTFNVELAGISCPSLSDCTAVGVNETARGQRVLAEHWNGKHSAVQATPNPKGRAPQLNAVSCPSPADCMAVGSYFIPNPSPGLDRTLAERHQL